VKTRFESQFSRMNCHVVGLSSGHLGGSGRWHGQLVRHVPTGLVEEENGVLAPALRRDPEFIQ
jgi:hypothetical protein